MENEKAIELSKTIDQLIEKRDSLMNDIILKKEQLQLICIHDETKKVDKYEEGSYFDRSRYITEIRCNLCNRLLESDIRIGSYC